jgi:protein-disulfide isomerase
MRDVLTLTRRDLIAGAAALAALSLAGPLAAQGVRPVVEMSLGSPDAPVTLIEYASFTCPHCAAFNKEVMPRIKAEYIDTGKVRLVYREVYFDGPSLWASVVARCAGEDRFFGVVDVLFARQAEWAHAQSGQDVVAGLTSIGKTAGLTEGEVMACLNDEAFRKSLVEEFQKNAAADDVRATPSFVLNGRKVANMPWPEFKAEIDAALGS